MLFAATAASQKGIPVGQLDAASVAPKKIDGPGARDRLALLAEAIELDDPPARFDPFVDAAAGSTQRIATRAVRYRFYRWALTGQDFPRK